MPIQLHIQKMKREADVIKKNEKSANEYLTQTIFVKFLTFLGESAIIVYGIVFCCNKIKRYMECNCFQLETVMKDMLQKSTYSDI